MVFPESRTGRLPGGQAARRASLGPGQEDADRTTNQHRVSHHAGWAARHCATGSPSQVKPTQIESEAALKVFFADQAGITELRATITGIRHDAANALQRLGAMAAGEHEFRRARRNERALNAPDHRPARDPVPLG